MKLTSPAFNHQEMMPSVFSCDGKNISPGLEWEELPEGTNSLALIMDDPDATSGTCVHWVIYEIPPSSKALEENLAKESEILDGVKQGVNSSNTIGYIGPCPPSGTHRYVFKLYALESKLDLSSGITKDELIKGMQGHILEETQLIGTYKR